MTAPLPFLVNAGSLESDIFTPEPEVHALLTGSGTKLVFIAADIAIYGNNESKYQQRLGCITMLRSVLFSLRPQ